MLNLQAATNYLYNFVDLFVNISSNFRNIFSDEPLLSEQLEQNKENTDVIAEQAKSLIEFLYNHYGALHQSLAHILLENFGGEYLMSGYEVSSEMEGYVFFIDYIKNDDGSVKIIAKKEKTK